MTAFRSLIVIGLALPAASMSHPAVADEIFPPMSTSAPFIGEGYTITIPSDWCYVSTTSVDNPAWILDPKKPSRAYIGVTITPIKPDQDLKAASTDTMTMFQILPGYKLVSTSDEVINGQQATDFDFEDLGPNKTPERSHEVLFVKGNKLYIASCTAETDDFDGLKSTFDAFGKSLQFAVYRPAVAPLKNEQAFHRYGYSVNVPKVWKLKADVDGQMHFNGPEGELAIGFLPMPELDVTERMMLDIDVYNKALLKAQPHYKITDQKVTDLDGRSMIMTDGFVTDSNGRRRRVGFSGKVDHGRFFILYFVGSAKSTGHSDAIYARIVDSFRWGP